MPWSVHYNSAQGYVESVYIGRVTGEEFRQATVRALELARQHRCLLFLIDDSKWEGGATPLDLFQFPAYFEELDADRRSRAALILPAADSPESGDAGFFETVCRNRGWNVSMFSDRQFAIDWLLQG